MATKIGRGDYIPDIYPYAKLHYDLIRGFCPKYMQSCLSDDHSAIFLGGGSDNSLPPRPCTDFINQYVKRRFGQGCSFWGPENETLHFDPI